MRIWFSFIATVLTLTVLAQDTSRFTVLLKGLRGDAEEIPSHFDTIYLNSTFQKNIKVYTNIITSDSAFKLSNIPTGKYWLRFSSKDFLVIPLSIVVCTKCDNQFAFFAYPKKRGDNCSVFSTVEITAGYLGGNKALSKDFLKSISKKEKKLLKSGADISIHFYLTKQKEVSDVRFLKHDVQQEIKNIIIKGLMSLKNWAPAIQNGNVVDAEYFLNTQTLLNK